jgi:hypothetical protein
MPAGPPPRTTTSYSPKTGVARAGSATVPGCDAGGEGRFIAGETAGSV